LAVGDAPFNVVRWPPGYRVHRATAPSHREIKTPTRRTRVFPEFMRGSLTQKRAAVSGKMPLEIALLHAAIVYCATQGGRGLGGCSP
jgi:hypothetical protein